jgi:hypothetical protein
MLEDENPDNFAAPPQAAMALRQLVGRAYLLDLAVLSQSDAVVCAVSASACRILAVMMGWDKAIKENKWRNVDGGYGWRGMVVVFFFLSHTLSLSLSPRQSYPRRNDKSIQGYCQMTGL